jgi:acetyl-CoA carboxylase biotin carboxylase subunit
MNIRRILIANRGEIAVRIIRTCQNLGIETILAASEADLNSVPARLADSVVCIGPPQSALSYLNVDAIVAAAIANRADAIHPGYGFLAENARLARGSQTAGIVFIGPTEQRLVGIGDKLMARQLAVEARLPVVPGGALETIEDAQQLAAQLGWPILIKAVGGGGGRGMKQVNDPNDLKATIELAVAEADAAFGDARVYMERYVAAGRHIEVQVLGDGENVIHIGDRDCSIQRRYQKLVEEAPAIDLTEDLRSAMHGAAIRFCKHLSYRGLGTVEFLVDCQRNEYYFLEMNARIQVEHPVTEAISGIDLIEEQIAVAEGRPLRLRQHEIALSGHAIECRINAEDCAHDFRPCPGAVSSAVFPAGPEVRVDTHIEAGSAVPSFYDSLLAKIIVHGADRAAAIANMKAALSNCRIDGIHTNLVLHQALMSDADFVRGAVDTGFLPRFLTNAFDTEILKTAHG